MPDSTPIGRLALRHEGPNLIAYFALRNTMENAVQLGSISVRAIRLQPQRQDQFMKLMQELVADLLEELLGQRPSWPTPPEPAPEHERAGHG